MKISARRWPYIIQPCLVVFYAAFVLVLLHFDEHSAVFDAVALCSLLATAFAFFIMPRAPLTKLKNVLGGYAISLLSGVSFSLLAQKVLAYFPASADIVLMVFGLFSLFFVMVLMIALDYRHPPAMGLALALLILPWTSIGLLMIALAIFVMAGVYKIFYPYLQAL
ncbi:MAG: HPP family protein [Gammaproteobacteria bacterium]|nr:HPP family protein [Gammaproteobacteria bacterium]MCD8542653.1 HPP family protein [Gammaproteobacteria bacterium]